MIYISNELTHYGVKGMKWGVRHDQYENARRLLTYDLKARKKQDEIYAKEAKKISKLKTPDQYFGPDGRLSAEGRKHYNKVGKIHDRTNKRLKKAYKQEKREIHKLQKKVFLNKKTKTKIEEAHNTLTKINSIRDNTIGENSPYAQKAYKEYKKTHNDNDGGYGFFHYKWRSGNQYYDQANKEYKSQSSQLTSKYNNQITDIGRTIAGDQLKSIGESHTMTEVDQFVRFRYKEFDVKKRRS